MSSLRIPALIAACRPKPTCKNFTQVQLQSFAVKIKLTHRIESEREREIMPLRELHILQQYRCAYNQPIGKV